MAVTVSGETLLQAVIRRGGLGVVLLKADTSATTTTLVSVAHLRNANITDTLYYRTKRTIIYRPGNATGVADMVRWAAAYTGSTGTIAPDTAWAAASLDTSENAYLLFDGLHPEQIKDAMNRAGDIVYFDNFEPLCIKPTSTLQADAGFQSVSSVWIESDADGGPAMTHSKVTTANSDVAYPGMIGSGRALNGADAAYIRQRFYMTDGDSFNVFALSKLAAGTNAQLVLNDVDGSALIGTAVEHDQKSWQWMYRLGDSVPSGSSQVEARLQGEGASADVYWNAFCLYPANARLIELSTTWDTAYKMPALYAVMFEGRSTGTGVVDARASRLVEVPRSAYNFQTARGAANPNAVYFEDNSWLRYPLFIQGRRAHADVETAFTLALTQTRSADADLFTWATLKVLFEENPGLPDHAAKLRQFTDKFRQTSLQFQNSGPAEKKPEYHMPRLS